MCSPDTPATLARGTLLFSAQVTHHLTLTRPSPLSPRVQQPGTIHIPRDTGQSRKPVLLVTTGESLLPPHGQGPGALLVALRWPLGKGRATRGSPAPRLPPTSPRSRTPVSRREGRQLRLAGLRLRRVVQNPLHLLLDFAGLQQPAVVVQPDLEVAAPVEYDDVLAVPDVLDGVWGGGGRDGEPRAQVRARRGVAPLFRASPCVTPRSPRARVAGVCQRLACSTRASSGFGRAGLPGSARPLVGPVVLGQRPDSSLSLHFPACKRSWFSRPSRGCARTKTVSHS